jgi:pimeloyl-ACP methyl ester carboxylesterase
MTPKDPGVDVREGLPLGRGRVRVGRGAGPVAARIALRIVLVLVGCLLGIAGLVRAWSPGKPRPFVDKHGDPLPGSISEKLHITINGVEQGMFIKSRDVRNPVLLFLHGGPGMPEYWLTQRYPTGLERHFTVAWWEQRGAGLSYGPDIPPETMTIEQFISDTMVVTDYLRERFGAEKIYLMAHSWGSYVGIQVAARQPGAFHAYIGISQITHQVRSERLSYEYMLQRFTERGDSRMVRRLAAAPVTLSVPLPAAYDALRDKAMHMLGVGTTRDMRSVVTGLFLPSWSFREYTLGEKVKLWRGKRFSRRFGLWDQMQASDLTTLVTELDIPAYFLHGSYDYTVSCPMAKSYAGRLKAPMVGFYTFEGSAHSPFLEEPERTVRILTEDVLAGVNRLADADTRAASTGTD